MKSWWLVCGLSCALVACGDNKELPGPVDAPPIEPDAPPVDPFATLQGTGLCDDAGCLTINAGIQEYEPKFPLYSDGAAKRRWIQLPAGSQIDTSNMDRWVFPVGTKLWKEFTRDNIRVETRFITKELADDDAPNAWRFFTYVWNTAQDAAMPVTAGQMDANGTPHNVPSRGQCRDCHDSLRPSRVLGFQAIQLDHDATAPLVDLEDLITAGTLTVNPTTGTAGDRFPLPGDDTAKAALGYMHANCGTCHNATSTTHDIVKVELLLDTTKLANVEDTPTFRTAVFFPTETCGDNIDNDGDGNIDNGCPQQTLIIDDVTIPHIISPQNVQDSGVIARMQTTGIKRMPKIAVETPDAEGIAIITAWINSIPL
jgi:cytochrome c553